MRKCLSERRGCATSSRGIVGTGRPNAKNYVGAWWPLQRDLQVAQAEATDYRGQADSVEVFRPGSGPQPDAPHAEAQAAPGPFAGPYRDDAPDRSGSDAPAPTMTRRRSRRTPAGLARCVLKAAIPALLVLTPLGAIVFLTVAVLWPTAKDPQSKIYSTVIGHPAIQRLLGRPIDIPIAAHRQTGG